MKKITTILMLLMLSMGAWAQTALMEGYGDPLTLTQFKAMAGTGQRFGFVASSNTAGDAQPRCDHWVRWTDVHNGDLDETALFYLETSGNFYKVKRCSDGLYVNTSTSSTSFGEGGFEFDLVNQDPSDVTKAVTGAQSIRFKNSEAENWYNVNAVKLNTGGGAWTTYAVFGPIYKNVTVDCQLGGVSMDGYPQQFAYKAGTVEAPEYPGKKLVDGQPTSVTISEDNQTITFNYESSSFDYTLVVNGAPEGTTITIKGEPASAGAVSFDSEVAQSDVVVTLPQTYYTYAVVIDGTTITINIEDTRWPVNFDKSATSTHSQTDRSTRTITLDGQTINVPGQSEVPPIIYNDCTDQSFTVGAGAVVTPSFGYNKNWMHGFVYIDLNNDGDFTDEGELVAKSPTEGSPNLATDVAAFTLPGEGTYRMRWKVDWANEDPGGTGPGNNYIASNGGAVIDVTLTVVGSADVTFKVLDANDNTLLEAIVPKPIGEVISELPSDLKRSFTTYTYPDGNLTVTSGGDNVFTAVATFNLPFTSLTNFADATWYYMTIRSNKYVQMADTEPYATTTANGETEAYQWAFSGNPYTGVKVYNKAAGSGKTFTKDGTKVVMRDGEYSWTILDNSDGFILQETGSANNYVNEVNGTIGFWNSTLGRTDNGGTFRLTKVPENTITYIKALEGLSNDKVYTIHNTPRAMWMFTETALAADPLSGVNIYDEVANPAAKHQIAIVKQNNKYYLYSVAQKKYLAAGNKLYKSPLEAVEIIESTAKNGNYMWFFRFEGYTDRNINTNGTPAIEINWWSSHDYGNTNAIMETNATYTVADALAAFTDYTQCITDYCAYKGITTDFVQNIGKLGYPKAGTEATTAFLAILERKASGTNTAEDWNTFMDKYNAVFAAENMKMPEAGMFLRIKTAPAWAAEKFSGEQPYLIAENSTASAGRAAFSTTAGNDVSSIWCWVEDGEGENKKNYLISYPDGRPLVNNSNNMIGYGGDTYMATGATTVTFKPATDGEVGAFGILYASGSRALYTNAGLYTDGAGSTASGAGYNFELEEVTTLPITLRSTDGATYFATFSAPVNVQISGASLNTVTSNGKTAAYNTVDTDMLKAGVGVLLSGTSATATATIITDEVPDANYGLVSYYAATAGTGDESMLYLGKGKTSGKAGFYKLGSGTSSNGFKAYLNNTTVFGGAKEGFELEFGGVTGIENMENGTLNMENGAVYNLQGQRVNKAQKGVFIQNGKKVVVR